MRSLALVSVLVGLATALIPMAAMRPALAAEVEADVQQRVNDLQSLKVAAVKINPFVYKIEGEGAIFLINTRDGSVLVDVGYASPQALEQKKLVEELGLGPKQN